MNRDGAKAGNTNLINTIKYIIYKFSKYLLKCDNIN